MVDYVHVSGFPRERNKHRVLFGKFVGWRLVASVKRILRKCWRLVAVFGVCVGILLVLALAGCYEGTQPNIVGANTLTVRLQGDTDVTLPVSGSIPGYMISYSTVNSEDFSDITQGWSIQDLSGIIPAGSIAIEVVATEYAGVYTEWGVRSYGETTERKISINPWVRANVTSGVSSDLKVEYFNYYSSSIHFQVMGYWK